MLFNAQLEAAVKKKVKTSNVDPTDILKTAIPKESFIRCKTSLESGVLNQASNLKKGDRSRLLLGSKAAKLSGVYTPMAVHFRNQARWAKTRGTRKHPQILGEFQRKGGL